MSIQDNLSTTPPATLPLLNLPSIFKKKISIKKEDDGIDGYVHFIFVSSDSKSDIHEEISKCFNMERFSLRDSERNFITGSYDSLERESCYDIIDRSGKRSRSSYSEKSDNTNESVTSSELNKSVENEDKQPNSKNVKVRKRKEFTSPLQAKKRKTLSSQNSVEQTDNITNNNKEKTKSTQLPRACSKCRQIKKRCDRQRPCERCIKLGLTQSCDAGKTDHEEQN